MGAHFGKDLRFRFSVKYFAHPLVPEGKIQVFWLVFFGQSRAWKIGKRRKDNIRMRRSWCDAAVRFSRPIHVRNTGNETPFSHYVCSGTVLWVWLPRSCRRLPCSGSRSERLHLGSFDLHYSRCIRSDQCEGLDALACQIAGVPSLPSDPSTYGCAILFNFTLPPQTITSLNLTFSGLDGLTFECDTKGITGSIFTQSSCGSLGAGTDAFSFYNGSFPFFSEAVIYETGVDPDLFKDGSASVNQPPITVFASEVPEPSSMLLLSTGVTMAGAYLTKQRRRFGFTKK